MDRRLSVGCESVYGLRAKMDGKPVELVICRDRLQWARLGRVGILRAAYQPVDFLLGVWAPNVSLRLPPHPWVVVPLSSISNVAMEADDDIRRGTVVVSTAEEQLSFGMPAEPAQVVARTLDELLSGVQPTVLFPSGPPPSPPRPGEPVATAGWYADPFARHELRYWSGTAWTEDVSTRGSGGRDPVG